MKNGLRTILAVVASAVMYLSQVGPDDAVSNLAKWWKLATDRSPPDWLAMPSFDTWAFGLSAAVLTIALVPLVYALFASHVAPNKSKEPLCLVPDMSIKELCRFLRFETRWAVRFQSSDECILAVLPEIERQLRLEQLTCWGTASGERAPQRLPSQIWTGRTISPQALDAHVDQPVRTVGPPFGNASQIYEYLEVNTSETMRVWPRAPFFARMRLASRMKNAAFDLGVADELRRYARRKRLKRERQRAIRKLIVKNGLRFILGWRFVLQRLRTAWQ
jgi:hypothetical protein